MIVNFVCYFCSLFAPLILTFIICSFFYLILIIFFVILETIPFSSVQDYDQQNIIKIMKFFIHGIKGIVIYTNLFSIYKYCLMIIMHFNLYTRYFIIHRIGLKTITRLSVTANKIKLKNINIFTMFLYLFCNSIN